MASQQSVDIQAMSDSVCNTWARLKACLSILVLPGIEGLLWGRIYAMMSQHNQSSRWVLGALGLLLYMGNLGTVVFIVTKVACGLTGLDVAAIVLGEKFSYSVPV
ncbi:hypothetical protein JB92DRAFT_2839215 [Gautieria morchelliformis]|nr:hypothetical protein JB92DRAFT_2839215 [Gautieria morchelliformis]